MLNRIKSEPALVAGLVQTVIALVVAFGLDLSTEQVGAIMAVTAAGLALFTRSKVTPVGDEPGEDGVSDLGLILAVVILIGALVLLGRL